MRNTKHPRSFLVCAAVAAAVAMPLCAQDNGPTTQATPKRPWGLLPKDFGWLSSPDEKPETIGDALIGGKFGLNNRLRYERADASGARASDAFTNRYRFGYTTKRFHGFTAMAEVESVQAINGEDNWYVPATGQGDPSRTVIADPVDFELNRWGLNYKHEGDFGLDVTGGRQRVILDNQRFVGNVGWRQFEQTLDAGRFQTDFGQDGLMFEYSYVWYVQRIFSVDGPSWDSDSHLIRAQYDLCPECAAVAFAYLLDFDDDSPANSNNSFGLRFHGQIGIDNELSVAYQATWAYQTDAGDNPTDYDANYVGVDASLDCKDLGSIGVGYEFIGSDNGNASVRFPLGTNHAFNGWADVFLTPPPEGLQDLYGYVKVSLPWKVKGQLVYHSFWTDEGSDDLGWEIDTLLKRKISANWSVLTKAAFFDGQSGVSDVARFWVQTEFSF